MNRGEDHGLQCYVLSELDCGKYMHIVMMYFLNDGNQLVTNIIQ